MRLNEITNINKTEIESMLKEYFRFDSSFNIHDDGEVDMLGDCRLKKPATHFPFNFGTIFGSFITITNGGLVSLVGSPKRVDKNFYCFRNKITTLIGGPITVGGNYNVSRNPVNSLDGIPESIQGDLVIDYYRDLPIIRLLKVKNVTGIHLYSRMGDSEDDVRRIEEIVNRYLGKGRGGALQCAAELVKAGFKGNARL
jgi:hypothetical protein